MGDGARHKQMWSIEQITSDIVDLGVHPGAPLLVHASMRSIGIRESGAAGLIDALQDASNT